MSSPCSSLSPDSTPKPQFVLPHVATTDTGDSPTPVPVPPSSLPSSLYSSPVPTTNTSNPDPITQVEKEIAGLAAQIEQAERDFRTAMGAAIPNQMLIEHFMNEKKRLGNEKAERIKEKNLVLQQRLQGSYHASHFPLTRSGFNSSCTWPEL